jgi:hypothetical protein
MKIYKIIMLPVFVWVWKLVSHSKGRSWRLRVFENRVSRKIFRRKRDEVKGDGENCATRSFMIYTHHQGAHPREGLPDCNPPPKPHKTEI